MKKLPLLFRLAIVVLAASCLLAGLFLFGEGKRASEGVLDAGRTPIFAFGIQPSPYCMVLDTSVDGGSYQLASPNGVNVTGGDTVQVELVSTAGVRSWSLSVFGLDDITNPNPPQLTFSVGPPNSYTFTFPNSTGRTVLLKSTVNGGVDINGTQQPSYTTTIGIFSLTPAGQRVLALGETFESCPVGWVCDVNSTIRSVVIDGGVFIASSYNTTGILYGQFQQATGLNFIPAQETLLLGVDASTATFKCASGVSTCYLTQSITDASAGASLVLEGQQTTADGGTPGPLVVLSMIETGVSTPYSLTGSTGSTVITITPAQYSNGAIVFNGEPGTLTDGGLQSDGGLYATNLILLLPAVASGSSGYSIDVDFSTTTTMSSVSSISFKIGGGTAYNTSNSPSRGTYHVITNGSNAPIVGLIPPG